MAISTDGSDEMYINEYGGTAMIRESLTCGFSDIRMPDRSYIQRYYNDELPPALIDSIILDLLEELAKLKSYPNPTPPNRPYFTGLPSGNETADAWIDDAMGGSGPITFAHGAAPSGDFCGFGMWSRSNRT